MKKNETSRDIVQDLELGNKKKGSLLKKMVILPLILIAVIIGVLFFKDNNEEAAASYETRKVTRGNLVVTVSATGNLEPRNQVDVGSELSGIVKTVEVDINDHVVKDQVLATIDTSRLEAQAKQSNASLESASAKVLDSQATVKEMQNELNRLRHVWELSGKKVPSQNELGAAEAALQRAIASEASAKAQVSQAKAALEANETDIGKMVIRSPINGIVLNRNVEPGQTVAASFQAPVLFTLAEDLTKMRLSVDVDEADVGMVTNGQDATFTVDAYPEKTFKAKILQVKYGSDTTEGVVTYETLLSVDNKDLLLRPGMTATAEIIVKHIENAVLVPNAALRFEPPATNDASTANKKSGGLINTLMPGPGRRFGAGNNQPAKKQTETKKVWILKNNRPEPVMITAGLTDGNMTQIIDGDLDPGMDVITGTAEQ